jgi:hypothetical protein
MLVVGCAAMALMALVVERLISPAVNGIDEPPVISADPTTSETSVAG